jgi:glutamine amidotransferase
MTGTIAIIDYQMGNLRSVQKALEKSGGHSVVTDQPGEILAADKVILPGVGAFGDAMHELRKRDLIQVVRDVVNSGKPFLGICLGMQLLFERGEEGGEIEGIGILKGRVKKFEIDRSLKVPHMGWNSVHCAQPDNALLDAEAVEPYFYFVHSYFCEPEDQKIVWLECDYGGKFCAAIHQNNVYATQFHPEKSQQAGLELLRRFIAL